MTFGDSVALTKYQCDLCGRDAGDENDKCPQHMLWRANAEIRRLRDELSGAYKELDYWAGVATEHLHQRRCRDCGKTHWHSDSVTPYVNCPECGSQDTRKVREPDCRDIAQ